MAETKPTSRERTNFSKIRTAIQIPNLIEVQKNSYERFLQMNMLPEEREDTGLQAVFNSVFPISDFRGVSTLEFISYSIGNWECKCGNLKGLHHLRSTCKSCGATIAVPLMATEYPNWSPAAPSPAVSLACCLQLAPLPTKT